MADAATRALVWIATHGPIAWASNWHSRVDEAVLNDALFEEPLTLAAVLPWRVSSATPSPLFPDIPSVESPTPVAERSETSRAPTASADSESTSSKSPAL